MDDFAKSAFLWAERILDEQEERGICCAILSVIDPTFSTETILWVEDVTDIFLPFAELHYGYSWRYPGDEPPYRGQDSIHYFWFLPREFLSPRKRLIHCLLSHSPL